MAPAADDIGPRTAAAAVIDSALQPASVTAIDSALDLQPSGTITNSLTTTSTPLGQLYWTLWALQDALA